MVMWFPGLFTVFVSTLWSPICVQASEPQSSLQGSHDLEFTSTWKCLGPFKIGTREAIWGSDPLEVIGGFPSFTYDKDTRYSSALTPNASVEWSSVTAQTSQDTCEASAAWSISFPEVDWGFMQDVYGWSALQYQAWIRGQLYNHSPDTQYVQLYMSNVLEFRVNEAHVFGGDFYGFSRAPIPITLKPGANVFNVRLVRDVRSSGGFGLPVIEAELRIAKRSRSVHTTHQGLVVPELYDGRLSSPFVGINIQNTLEETVTVRECLIRPHDASGNMLSADGVRLSPGQTRPVAFRLRHQPNCSQVHFRVCYGIRGRTDVIEESHLDFEIALKNRSVGEAHKITFLHPSGVVSYAILKAPQALDSSSRPLPVLVNLHGAGVEADSEQVRHSLDSIRDLESFALFPSGMSPWSGDDWHTWGLADTLAAIDAVDEWTKFVNWTGPPAETGRVIISGHSNGGQGTWYFVTHHPDRTLAATPVSGYTSIENYVPYNLWNIGDQDEVLQMVRKSYRNELFVANLASIPIMQQHGGADDNVPPYHSRLMSSLRAEHGDHPTYIEIPGAPHWWTGAMTTPNLLQFYHEQIRRNASKMAVPAQFSVVTAASDDFGSRFGLVIDQVRSPSRLARIDVQVDAIHKRWHLKTSNVQRFHFDDQVPLEKVPSTVLLDFEPEPRPVDNRSFAQSSLGQWNTEEGEWRVLSTRYGRQRGALDAILRTQGAFQLVDHTNSYSLGLRSLTLQTSLNLLQYFGADCDILGREEYHQSLTHKGNVILFATGTEVPRCLMGSFPITFTESGILMTTKLSPPRLIEYTPGLSAVMLRPLANERLELLVWGSNYDGLERAARMIPTLTGCGQPDFIVFGKESRWLGHKGATALGFFDSSWSISESSYV